MSKKNFSASQNSKFEESFISSVAEKIMDLHYFYATMDPDMEIEIILNLMKPYFELFLKFGKMKTTVGQDVLNVIILLEKIESAILCTRVIK